MTGMTDGIIAGYDGSASSDEALRWAARQAWARGATLTICLVWPAADLRQLGDWGLGGLEGMSLGSVAGALVHHSPCPVAVIHHNAH